VLDKFLVHPLSNFHTSDLDLVSKHDGGWQIIYHFSAPFAHSINDYIDPQSYSIHNLTPEALMSKIDLKNTFHLISVRPDDWNLLGICWRKEFYVDTCLPFSLRSAPHIFNQLSTSIHWILQHSYGVQHLLHYLDDFFIHWPSCFTRVPKKSLIYVYSTVQLNCNFMHVWKHNA